LDNNQGNLQLQRFITSENITRSVRRYLTHTVVYKHVIRRKRMTNMNVYAEM